jgi:hypothetical protein
MFAGNSIEIAINDKGDSTFRHISLGKFEDVADASDFDGDNDVDLLVHSVASGTVWIDRNEAGTFQRTQIRQDERTETILGSFTTTTRNVRWENIDLDPAPELIVDWSYLTFESDSGDRFHGDRLSAYDLSTTGEITGNERMLLSGCGYTPSGDVGMFSISDWNDDGNLDAWCAALGDGFNAGLSVAVNDVGNFYRIQRNDGISHSPNTIPTDAGDINADGYVDFALQSTNGLNWIDGKPHSVVDPLPVPVFDQLAIPFGGELATDDIEVIDMNDDGYLDVVTSGADGIDIWRYNHSFGVSLDLDTHIPVIGVGQIAVGDVDGDGDNDIVATMNGPNIVLLNHGVGRFTDSGQRLGDRNTVDIAIGDLDADGDLDIFAANGEDEPNIVWVNDGAGVFEEGWSLGNGDSRSVVLADVDADGDLDAVVANGPGKTGDGASYVWLNSGDADFTPHAISEAFDARYIVIAEFNGNDKPEFAIINSGNGEHSIGRDWSPRGFDYTYNLLGAGDGNHVAVGDVDNRGSVDLVIANRSSNPNTLWVADGRKTSDALGSSNSNRVALGDIDRDGDLDALFANDGANSLFINRTINNSHASQPRVVRVPSVTGGRLSIGEAWFQFDAIVGSEYSIELSGSGPITANVFPQGPFRFNAATFIATSETIVFSVGRELGCAPQCSGPIDYSIKLRRPDGEIPGDANRDGVFNSSDLVQVFQAGEYEDELAENSFWETGDWNDDGEFNSSDFVVAWQFGAYERD